MNTRCIVHIFPSTVRGSGLVTGLIVLCLYSRLFSCAVVYLDSFAHDIQNYSFRLDFIVCLYRIIRKLTAYALSVRNNTICRKCYHARVSRLISIILE